MSEEGKIFEFQASFTSSVGRSDSSSAQKSKRIAAFDPNYLLNPRTLLFRMVVQTIYNTQSQQISRVYGDPQPVLTAQLPRVMRRLPSSRYA